MREAKTGTALSGAPGGSAGVAGSRMGRPGQPHGGGRVAVGWNVTTAGSPGQVNFARPGLSSVMVP